MNEKVYEQREAVHEANNRVQSPESSHCYTSGPWTLNGPVRRQRGECVYALSGNGHLVATLDHEYSKNQRANARLISAAPELLETCEFLHALLYEPATTWEEWASKVKDRLPQLRGMVYEATKKARYE